MPLSLELRLVEQLSDSIVVAISLIPEGESRVDGVALELRGHREQSVGVRMVLPIAGRLTAPIYTRAEIRLPEEPVPGLTVVGTAWCGDEEVAARCPAEPCTGLDDHVRGCPCALPQNEPVIMEVASPEEHARLAKRFPWVGVPDVIDTIDALPPTGAGAEEEDEDEDEDDLCDLCDSLGLDDENTEWLKELLAEDL